MHHPTPPLLALLAALSALCACDNPPPPEAPPPSGCGPGMVEIKVESKGLQFCADRAMVSVASYSECVGRAACSVPARGRGCRADDLATHQQFINCVDLAQADAYCKWQKKRLLTQQELTDLAFSGRGDVVMPPNGTAEWVSSAWPSAPAQQPAQATAMRHDLVSRVYFVPEGLAPSEQRPELGFRCAR